MAPAWSRDVEPVPPLQAVAVQGQRQVVERVRHEERDQLLRVVEGTVRVRAARDHHVEPVGHVVRPRQQLAGGLRRRVGRARRQGIGLDGAALLDRPVDLVGGDLEEARSRCPLAAPGPLRLAAQGLQQDVDAVHAGAQEGGRLQDRAVDVALGGEVDDGVGGRGKGRDGGRVGDVAVDEREAGRHLGVGLHVAEVRPVARVGQLVEDGDPGPVAAAQDVADEAAPDEPGAAGDQEVGPRARERSRGGPLRRRGSCPSASAAAASWAARSREGTVPASAQCPS